MKFLINMIKTLLVIIGLYFIIIICANFPLLFILIFLLSLLTNIYLYKNYYKKGV